MQEGRVPGQSDILVAWPAEHVLVFRPAEERGLKPSLTTTTAKASERVIADPLGREKTTKAPATLGHPWPADVNCRQCAKAPAAVPVSSPGLRAYKSESSLIEQ